ncbi:MAG: hypothetical protein CBARDMAM_2664 [uncultured Caballeronia sp.]|nr:MAG: hypothetical protein CBARDMAM_2664 [uncultured Caballeronia sp.]
MRFRVPMPARIIATQPDGREWIIELVGRAKYRFRLATANRILPNPNLAVIRIPDNTPEIIAAYALDDEQALLAKVLRYHHRLINIFLDLTTFSLQNHLRMYAARTWGKSRSTSFTSVSTSTVVTTSSLYKLRVAATKFRRYRPRRTLLGARKNIRRCDADRSLLNS